MDSLEDGIDARAIFAQDCLPKHQSLLSFYMGPCNDHELRIARIVDRIDIEGRLYPTAIDEVVAVLDFRMTEADGRFLVDYIRWRMDNPIAK